MSDFDPTAFGNALLEDLRTLVKAQAVDAKDLRARLAALQADVESTFEALQNEVDPAQTQALKDDLARALPSRRAALLSVAASRLGNEAQAAFETALDIAIRVAVVAARAFL